MKYELIYNNDVVFESNHYNACIGQAKFFYRRKGMNQHRYMIREHINGCITNHDVNTEILKED